MPSNRVRTPASGATRNEDKPDPCEVPLMKEKKAMPRYMSELDFIFADAINKHPAEAKSHFEIVDPNAWRVLPSGQANIVLMQGYGWIGPFDFSLHGQDYEVFGRKGQCEASQKLFWTIGAFLMVRRSLVQTENLLLH